MRKTTDRAGRKAAPIAITVLVVLYIVPVLLFVLPAIRTAGTEMKMAVPFLAGYLFLGGAVIVGVIRALWERLREIDGGEEDEASRY